MSYCVRRVVVLLAALCVPVTAAEPIDIGRGGNCSWTICSSTPMRGAVRLELHHPTPHEIVFKTDAPWEGNAAAYQSVFQDGNLYRMYYHGGHYRTGGPPTQALEEHPWVFCYAESDDGIHWRRPELGLCEFAGSKANNIILTPESLAEIRWRSGAHSPHSWIPTPAAHPIRSTRSSWSAKSPAACTS